MEVSNSHALDVYIGKRIRERRQKTKMSLNNIADKLGISYQQVQKYELAQARMSAAGLYQMSKIFGVTAQYFFEGFHDNNEKYLKLSADVISPDRSIPLNLLLVEDDAADELLTRRAIELQDVPINIFCVHDGEQAMDFLRNRVSYVDFSRPDLIILDLNLPKRSGQELLKEIKRDVTLQDIPVIILSNGVCSREMLNAYKNHAAGYICKAFDFEEFQKNMKYVIDYWAMTVILPNRA